MNSAREREMLVATRRNTMMHHEFHLELDAMVPLKAERLVTSSEFFFEATYQISNV